MTGWIVPYSGKTFKEKTFANFKVLWLFVKVFSMKFGGIMSLAAPSSNPQNFGCENPVFYQFAIVFSHESFPLYNTLPTAIKEGTHCYLYI